MTVPAGLIAPGNIDLGHRPVVKNKDGSISTVRSMSFEEDGREILIPTVSDDGRILSDDEAVKLYHRTGKHLGQFRSATEATAYAQQLHEQQAKRYGAGNMSAPVQPEPEFNPESVTDWINVLHHASAVPQDSPDYGDARAVAAQAWARIGHLNRKANQTDLAAVEKGPTSAIASAVGGLAHGASLGVGEPIAGVIDAASGGSFREGAARYREGIDRLEASHPEVAAAGEVAGMFAPAAAPARAVLGGIEAGVPLAARSVAGRIAAGAGSGAVIGGVSGFSEGGEDPGSLDQRLHAGKSGAVTGAALGTVLSGLGLKAGRGKVEGEARLSTRGAQQRLIATNERSALIREQLLQRRLDRGDAAPTTDLPIRQAARMVEPSGPKAHPDIVAAVRDYEAGRISGPDLRTAMDVARGREAPSPVVSRIRPEVSEPTQGVAPSPPPSPPSPMSRPTEVLAEDQPLRKTPKVKTLKVGDTRFGAKVVEPGPYQRVGSTRMQTPPQGTSQQALISQAIKQSGRHPELLEPIPTEMLQAQYDLARMMGGGDEAAISAVGRELARRAASPQVQPPVEAPSVAAKIKAPVDRTVNVPKTRSAKVFADQADDDLILGLRDSESTLQNPKIQSGLRVFHTDDHVGGVSKAGGGLGAHIMETARKKSESIMNELNRRGLTDEQIYDRMDAIAERESIQQVERGALGAPRARTPLSGDTPFAIGAATAGVALARRRRGIRPEDQ